MKTEYTKKHTILIKNTDHWNEVMMELHHLGFKWASYDNIMNSKGEFTMDYGHDNDILLNYNPDMTITYTTAADAYISEFPVITINELKDLIGHPELEEIRKIIYKD